MSGQHETPPAITSRLPGPPPGAAVPPGLTGPPRPPAAPPAAPGPVPAQAPPLVPLPEPVLAHEPPEAAGRKCHMCHAPEGEQALRGLGGPAPLVRCEDFTACLARYAVLRRPLDTAGGAAAGPSPVPPAAPPISSGAGAGTPPAAPAPGSAQTAANETGASQ